MDSNHRILRATLKVSLRSTEGKPVNRRKYSLKRPAHENRISLKLSNHFASRPYDSNWRETQYQEQSIRKYNTYHIVKKRKEVCFKWVSLTGSPKKQKTFRKFEMTQKASACALTTKETD